MRCYRGLLRAYPQAFLAEFEGLLCQAFGDLSHRAVRTKGLWGLFVLWMRTLPDLISSALSQRFRPGSDLRFKLRWILACAAGATLGIALALLSEFVDYRVRLQFGMRFDSQLGPRLRLLRDVSLVGLTFGFFQSLAFEWTRSRRVAWMFATMFGVAFSVSGVLSIPILANYLRVTIHPWRLILDQHEALYYGGGSIVCASLTGILQTLVLAHRNSRVLTWIPASAVGVLVCSFIVAASGDRIYRNYHSPYVVNVVLGVVAGLVYGLLTVLPLEWILKAGTTHDVAPVRSK
jgi:uncharacterized membrane protein